MYSETLVCREVDLREDLRLQVVSVACELVTLEVLVQEEAQAPGDSAQTLVLQARELATKARAVLSPSTNFDTFGEAVLRAALAVLSENVMAMRQVRGTLAQLVAPAPDIELPG
ncbi:hypothetical protein JJB11_21890 [Ramlibacter ginsenosidimutans]|uniref:Uncharacterized protein n=1 Tax=Ramlibacter ginsenosidimutans TaxID=502333 RepID=A0A934TW83_9BURK|nr:hypothetical protein [Ramlibacter ginsenosidimutans]MBK6008759.1 hypothetical protein [Ramlibacter ginsenosidimutans]